MLPSIYTERYCITCKIMKPPKASHCKDCNTCVKEFDHHCYVLGSCIGLRNWKNFVFFLTFTTLHAMLLLIYSCLNLKYVHEKYPDFFSKYQ